MDITGLIGFGAFTPAAAAPSGPITSIQQVSITIASSNSSNTATITSVDTTLTSIHFNGIDTDATTNDGALARVELTNATTVTAYRSGTTSNTCTVRATVVEWNSDWVNSVQHGTVALTGASTGNATISSVNTSYAIAVWLGNLGSTSSLNCARGMCRVKVNTATQVTAARGNGTDNATVGFCVIDFNSAKITSMQFVETTIATSTSSTNTTITSVDDTSAIMFWAGHSGAGTSIVDNMTDNYRNSTTNVLASRGAAPAGNTTISRCYIVEFAASTVNQSSRSEISFTGTSDVWTLGAISTVDTSKAIILNSGTRGGSATTFPTHLANSYLSSNSQATTTKRTGTNTTIYAIECCEFV